MGKKSKVAPVKTIYYRDASNDDFAVTKDVEKKVIDSKFNYLRLDNFFIRIWANFLYYIVAKPIMWLLIKGLFHFKVINKKVMKKRGKNGLRITRVFHLVRMHSSHSEIILKEHTVRV